MLLNAPSPTPQEALESLLNGRVLEANCHRVRFDPEDGITWFTNPYGVDGILCSRPPDLAVVTRFLGDMASDIDYGPIP